MHRAPPRLPSCESRKGRNHPDRLASRRRQPWLAFVDADGSIPASEVLRFFPGPRGARTSEKFMLFCLAHSHAGTHGQAAFSAPPLRSVFATVVANLFKTHVYDSQCGLKCWHARGFFGSIPCFRGGLCFDIELLSRCSTREPPLSRCDRLEDKPGGFGQRADQRVAHALGAWLLSRRSRTPTPH